MARNAMYGGRPTAGIDSRHDSTGYTSRYAPGYAAVLGLGDSAGSGTTSSSRRRRRSTPTRSDEDKPLYRTACYDRETNRLEEGRSRTTPAGDDSHDPLWSERQTPSAAMTECLTPASRSRTYTASPPLRHPSSRGGYTVTAPSRSFDVSARSIDDNTSARLAARLDCREAQVAAEAAGEERNKERTWTAEENGGGREIGDHRSRLFGGLESTIGKVGDVGQPMSTAESEVQSAALRHALLLEERGLQLEQATFVLRRKEEEMRVLRRELQRLAEVSVVDRESRRRLRQAEDEVSSLLQRTTALEDIAKERKHRLEEERHSRSTEKQSLLSEIERAKVEAAESAEALLREETATKASREMCEQMGGVCRQMRQAAEDAEERCSAAEEKARTLERALAVVELRAKDAEAAAELLKARLEATVQNAERTDIACKEREESSAVLRGILKEKEAMLKWVMGEAAEADRRADSVKTESARHRAGFDAMRARVDSNDREMAQLRVRLEAAGDLAASGALRNSQAQKELEELRSQLTSAGERETCLSSKACALSKKIGELHRLLEKLSSDLSASNKLAHDRLIKCEVSALAAADAETRLEGQKAQSDAEIARMSETAKREAQIAGEAADTMNARSEHVRAEGERILKGFQEAMVIALQRIDDALADALQGLGAPGEAGGSFGFESVDSDSNPCGVGSGLDVGIDSKLEDSGRMMRDNSTVKSQLLSEKSIRRRMWPGAVGQDARQAGASSGVDGLTCSAAPESVVLRNRHDRIFGRIMRRLVTARKFRAWVASEARRAGEGADKGLKELKSSWKAESERLKSAETKLTRLREETKYGERRAALEAREACYAKLERVETEKWTLKGFLASEEREVVSVRAHLSRLKEASDRAAATADERCRDMCKELDMEKVQRHSLQDKADLLEGKASLLQDKLLNMTQLIDRFKAGEFEQQQEMKRLSHEIERFKSREVELREETKCRSVEIERLKAVEHKLERDRDRLLQSQSALRDELAGEKECSRETRERSEARSEKLSKMLDDEQTLREREREGCSRLLEEERVAGEEETGRLRHLLEEERKARHAEAALGEAVLREVRETQGLLGETAPSSSESRDEEVAGSFCGMIGCGAAHGAFSRRRDRERGHPSALTVQASALKAIVADAADLVKNTGTFYDRYADTHRLSSHPAHASPRRTPKSRPGEAEIAAVAAGSRLREAEAHVLGNSSAVRELDERCYSLLDANAQLCLRVHGLGLQCSRLARERDPSNEEYPRPQRHQLSSDAQDVA